LEELKEKYVKISSLFSMGFFLSYFYKMEITDKDELELFNFMKGIKETSTKKYFEILFDFVDKHRKRGVFILFLKRVLQEMLYLAKSQLEFVTKELEKIEKEDDDDKMFQKRYINLLKGYYCPLEELDEMLNYFTRLEAYEKCGKIMSIKTKYYCTALT